MKAILVINMPDDIDFEKLERAKIYIYNTDTLRGIYRNARLKPIPEKIGRYGYSIYAMGWNDCIDEILGG